jgi:predicted NUDIX family NTP pyrophosphohydrolase
VSNFFAELKRRNVYKVAIAYGVVAWLLMQIASQIFPFFEVPNWACNSGAAQLECQQDRPAWTQLHNDERHPMRKQGQATLDPIEAGVSAHTRSIAEKLRRSV